MIRFGRTVGLMAAALVLGTLDASAQAVSLQAEMLKDWTALRDTMAKIAAEMPEDIATLMALVLGLGAIFGAAGGIMRLADQNLRALSTPDDHFAVWLVTVWMAVGAAATLNAALLASFYVLSAVTLVYAPMGKIRHCLYFFFSRVFFGRFFGRRAVLPHPESVR